MRAGSARGIVIPLEGGGGIMITRGWLFLGGDVVGVQVGRI